MAQIGANLFASLSKMFGESRRFCRVGEPRRPNSGSTPAGVVQTSHAVGTEGTYPWARVRRRPKSTGRVVAPATRLTHFGLWQNLGLRVLSLRGGTASHRVCDAISSLSTGRRGAPTTWLVCSTPAGVDRKMLCSFLGDAISSLSTGRRGAPTAWLVCSTPAGVGRKMLCSFLADAIPVVIHG